MEVHLRDTAHVVTQHTCQAQIGFSPLATYTSDIVTYKRGRDESVPTVPINGKYVFPTPYGGGRATVTLNQCDYTCYSGFTMKPGGKYVVKGSSGAYAPPSDLLTAHRFGCLDMNGRLYPFVSQDHRNESSVKAVNRIHNSDFNLAVFLGELGTTANMLLDAVQRLLYALAYARRGDWWKVAEELLLYHKSVNRKVGKKDAQRLAQVLKNQEQSISQSAANLWLSYKYGWRPLVNDIYALSKLMTDQEAASPPLLRSRSVVVKTNQLPKPCILYASDGKSHTGVETCIYFRVKNPKLFAMAGLGLTNPASLAWELVPLSFVIDWIVPIGAFLDALDGGVGVEIHHAYRSEWTRSVFTMYWVPGIWGVSGTPESANVEVFASMRYDVGASVLIPLPWIRSGFNVSQLISALALAKQRS